MLESWTTIRRLYLEGLYLSTIWQESGRYCSSFSSMLREDSIGFFSVIVVFDLARQIMILDHNRRESVFLYSDLAAVVAGADLGRIFKQTV